MPAQGCDPLLCRPSAAHTALCAWKGGQPASQHRQQRSQPGWQGQVYKALALICQRVIPVVGTGTRSCVLGYSGH